MKKQDFLNDVMSEIDSLKKHATEKELSLLDIKEFNPKDKRDCIYGQMTGNCESQRAKKLMNKSCVRVFDFEAKKQEMQKLEGGSFNSIKKFINGKNNGQAWDEKNRVHSWRTGTLHPRSYNYLSALEGYICLKGANTKGIIKYLKGEIDTLKL